MEFEDRALRYRRFAKQCLQMARACTDPQRSALFVVMAQQWKEMAERDSTVGFHIALDAFNQRQLDS
jgi:hypothetical protein